MSTSHSFKCYPSRQVSLGYVTHATDRALWALRLPSLEPAQADVARAWLDTIAREVKELEEAGSSTRDVREILTLKEDRTIAWTEDGTWDDVVRLLKVLPGES